MAGREYVFLNMDETWVSQVAKEDMGFVPTRQVQRQRGMVRKRARPDRHDVRTSLLGTVCNVPALQPHLPQVFLPCYSKHLNPPAAAVEEYRRARAPLEYWHRTNGWSSCRVMQRWMTRVRSIISSARPHAWVVVVLDCAGSHLHPEVLRHARRLGILMLFIPAGLTSLFQVLDVYMFADVKKRIRQAFASHMCASPAGTIEARTRIRCVAHATHDGLVQVDCREYFRGVGLAADFNGLSAHIIKLVGEQTITPALPLLEEFATLIGRSPHTGQTSVLHNLIMSGWLQLRVRPLDASPPAGAAVALPDRPLARRRGRDLPQDRPVLWDDVRMARLRRLHRDAGVIVPAAEQAVNVFL